MVQILEEGRPSFVQSLLGGLAEGIPGALQQYQQQKKQIADMQRENEAAKRFGIDLSGINDPNMRKQALTFALQGEQNKQKSALDFQNQVFLENLKQGFESEKLSGKNKEKLAPFQGALEVLDRMRELRSGGNLGIGATFSPLPNTRRDAGEYSQLGKSLIQLSTNIPIRNRQEFETLAENLYDPNITDAAAEGILNAMERIIKNSMAQFNGEETVGIERPISAPGIMKKSENKPPIKSFMR